MKTLASYLETHAQADLDDLDDSHLLEARRMAQAQHDNLYAEHGGKYDDVAAELERLTNLIESLDYHIKTRCGHAVVHPQ